MTQPVEAVIFDYGGVISVPVFHDLAPIDEELGVPQGSVHRLMFGSPDDPHTEYHQLETGEITLTEYLESIERRAPEILGRPLDLGLYARFTAERPLQVQWPMVHRVRELRGEGLRLALLTNNAKEFSDSWRASFPVAELFEEVIDSSEVGMRKPDQRIYELTCERLGVSPEAAVFLDDNLENIDAAQALGIDTVLVGTDCLRAIADLDAILARRGIAT
jgi:putative hydrolase of the HAD superfamily